MQIEMVDVETIKPYGNNPRVIGDEAVDAVAESIKQFGFRNPILVDAEMVIIAGHNRLLAAKKLGLKQAPIIRVLDLPPEKVQALRIVDNKSGELSEWDLKLLPIELADLMAHDFNLEALGFSSKELEELLNGSSGAAGLTDPDEIPEIPEAAHSQYGEVYQLGKHRLLVGDSTRAEDVARLMDGRKAEMCFTDPPWNVAIGEDSNPRHRQREGLTNDNLDPAAFAEFLGGFISRAKEVVEGDLYCVLGASEWPTLDAALRADGYHWSASIIWVKDQFVLGRSKFHRRYEPIWYGWHTEGKSSHLGDRTEDDVWEIPRPKRSDEHPTMKPVALVERALRNSCANGGLVYDPFLGSGTTLLAAEKTGRACFGLEIEPRFADVIRRRWAEFVYGEGCAWQEKTPALLPAGAINEVAG